MPLNTFIEFVKQLLGRSDPNQWVTDGLDRLEVHRDRFDTLPFTIVNIKNHGFLAKVNGLYAYIHFTHMPWHYPSVDVWKAVAPSLLGKRFFGKIHHIQRETSYIQLNGEIPQFATAPLTRGHEYQGIVINILEYGLFVDIGSHFDWKYGSITGLLHISQLGPCESVCDFHMGQAISILYLEPNQNGQPIFSNQKEVLDWTKKRPQALVGQILRAKVVRHPPEMTISFYVNGMYRACLSNEILTSNLAYRRKLRNAIRLLRHGQIIHCEVTGYNEQTRTLHAHWLTELDTDIVVDNAIINHLDNSTIAKLNTLKQQIDADSPSRP